MHSKAAGICLRFLKSFGTKVDIAEPVFSLDYNKDLSDGRFAQRETAIFVGSYSSILSAIAVAEIAEEAVDHTADTGVEAQNAVKPPDAGSDHLYHKAHIEHGEECAHAHHIAHPPAEEPVAQHNGYHHQRYVYDNLCFRKRKTRDARQSHGHTFARHGHRPASHLKGYSYSQYRTARQLGHNL